MPRAFQDAPYPALHRQPLGYSPCLASRPVSRARPAIRRSHRRREPPPSGTPASSAPLRNRRGWLLRFLLRAQPHHLDRNGGPPAARPRRSRRRQPPDFSIDRDIPRSGAALKVAAASRRHTGRHAKSLVGVGFWRFGGDHRKFPSRTDWTCNSWQFTLDCV